MVGCLDGPSTYTATYKDEAGAFFDLRQWMLDERVGLDPIPQPNVVVPQGQPVPLQAAAVVNAVAVPPQQMVQQLGEQRARRRATHMVARSVARLAKAEFGIV